jgi:hypothetical protein
VILKLAKLSLIRIKPLMQEDKEHCIFPSKWNT